MTDLPDTGPATVWHYDGVSALRRNAAFAVEGDSFRLIGDDITGEAMPLADLVARDAIQGDAIFGLKKQPGWRIGFPGGVPESLREALPSQSRYGGVIDRFGLWPSVAVSAVLATIVVILFLRTPAAVARVIPASVEQTLGDAMVGDFGNRACNGPGGREALQTLVTRVDPVEIPAQVQVINLPIINAVTLPGGHILIFDGLIKAAKSPDEVAGVLAHELGHVRNHDVMESLLRQVGLSVLLGGMEGHIGGYTNALLAASYSRGAEERADSYAIGALDRADITPEPTAAFFRRLEGDAAEAKQNGRAEAMLAYLSTHPITHKRAERFTASTRKAGGYRPVLDDAAWRRLRAICTSDKNVERGGFPF